MRTRSHHETVLHAISACRSYTLSVSIVSSSPSSSSRTLLNLHTTRRYFQYSHNFMSQKTVFLQFLYTIHAFFTSVGYRYRLLLYEMIHLCLNKHRIISWSLLARGIVGQEVKASHQLDCCNPRSKAFITSHSLPVIVSHDNIGAEMLEMLVYENCDLFIR